MAEALLIPQFLRIRSESLLRKLPKPVLSGRCVLLLGFICLLLLGPIAEQNDIIASVFAFSLLVIFLLFVSVTVFGSIFIKKKIDLSISSSLLNAENSQASSSSYSLIAQQPAVIIMRVSALQIPFLFVLSLRLKFKNGKLKPVIHQLTGRLQRQRVLREDIVFPHRGVWQLQSVEFSFSDQFRFSSDHWSDHSAKVCRNFGVRPAPIAESRVPLLSSCERSGDMMLDEAERRGDLFDLKRYHAADGMNKIVWKVYARTGQLLSRHPEKAMTPEGKVAVFCIADSTEDFVCAESIAYLKKNEEVGVGVYLGCNGMGSEPVALSSAQAENLVIDSVWNSEINDQHQLTAELRQYQAKLKGLLRDVTLNQLLLFSSKARSETAQGAELLLSLGQILESQKIAPVFVLTRNLRESPKLRAQKIAARRRAESASKKTMILDFIKRQLIEANEESSYSPEPTTRAFSQACALKKWKIIIP